MKKLASPLFLILTFVTLTTGQDRPRYVFDNFSSGRTPAQSSQQQQQQQQQPVQAKGQWPPNPSVKAKPISRRTGVKQIAAVTKRTAMVTPAGQAFPAEFGAAGSRNPMVKKTAGLRSSLGGYSTGDPQVDGYIMESCARHGVDPLLIYAQMNQESSFKLRATSNKGASGLMQLMPATAARFGVGSIYDPQQNIEGGVKYMRWLLDTFNGDVSLALAGYNAGEGAVMKYGYAIPPYNETQDYVRRISARYASLRRPGSFNFAPRERDDYEERMARAQKSPSVLVVKSAPRTSPVQVADIQKPAALNLYQKSIYAIKTKDGKVQLISQ